VLCLVPWCVAISDRKVTAEWRIIHNEELNDLYSSPNIICGIKLRMGWVGYAARTWGEDWSIQGFGGES
jgi:hypothetical protein